VPTCWGAAPPLHPLQAAPLPCNACPENWRARTQQGVLAVLWNNTEGGPAGKHILHRSPQKLGTTAEQVPHGITNHMMFVKLAAVLDPPQHRKIHLLQCLQLCYMVHVRQGSKRLCTLRFWSLLWCLWPALLPDMLGNWPYWCCACHVWSCQQLDHWHNFALGLCAGLRVLVCAKKSMC
jgi:hypothetical protein